MCVDEGVKQMGERPRCVILKLEFGKAVLETSSNHHRPHWEERGQPAEGSGRGVQASAR